MAASDASQDLFAVATPLGLTVRVSARCWETIVGKHHELAKRLLHVQAALREPDEVERGRRDPAVLLF